MKYSDYMDTLFQALTNRNAMHSNRHTGFLLVAIGDGHPSDRAGVTAQEEEGDVASGGYQVD